MLGNNLSRTVVRALCNPSANRSGTKKSPCSFPPLGIRGELPNSFSHTNTWLKCLAVCCCVKEMARSPIAYCTAASMTIPTEGAAEDCRCPRVCIADGYPKLRFHLIATGTKQELDRSPANQLCRQASTRWTVFPVPLRLLPTTPSLQTILPTGRVMGPCSTVCPSCEIECAISWLPIGPFLQLFSGHDSSPGWPMQQKSGVKQEQIPNYLDSAARQGSERNAPRL